jgi:hypothetical protein
MAIITSQNAAQAIVKIIANEALKSLLGTMVMGALVNRNYEPVMQQAGDTVNVPIAPSLVANNLAEGGTIQNQAASLGNAQVVLNTHAEASFQIPDVTKILVQPDLAKLYMDAAMKALAERVETDIMNIYPLLTDTTAVGGAAAITESVVDDAETALFMARVPVTEPKYLVVNANTYSDLRQIGRFTEENKIGIQPAQSALIEATMGRIKGLNVIRSHFVAMPSTTAYNLCFAKDAIALVTRRLPQPLSGLGAVSEYAELGSFGLRVTMSYAHANLGTQFSVDILYGVSTLRNSWGMQLQTNT